ncbi:MULTISPECIES: cupin domain-containing protein [Undibacterium]|jgi:quercetin dioxygenase-like cupin family protein|uniref:Cupin domain-containing protein n=1 Tax=Undibacterium umbellatum TaxID=2762300 RepID=A0ABR6ZDE5_9BURK|nr:cupin domain-containing protein [Undibacterium umbellatum]MBC3909762.1 cupin domain-containing protein [Undibacterium umbellatum]
MATPHLHSGEVSNLLVPEGQLLAVPAHALFKDEHLEVIRMNLAQGKSLPSHHVHGPLTIQCLSGEVQVELQAGTKTMRAGDLLYLAAGLPHAVLAISNTSFLVTIVLLKAVA